MEVAPATPVAGDIYRTGNTVQYQDTTNTTRLLLNAPDNLANLTNPAAARTNVGAILPTILTDDSVTTLGTTGAVAVAVNTKAIYDLTPTGNVTLTITGDSRGSATTIRVNASAFLITWSITGLKWLGGSAPTLPTIAGRSMLIAIKRFGTADWVGIASSEIF